MASHMKKSSTIDFEYEAEFSGKRTDSFQIWLCEPQSDAWQTIRNFQTNIAWDASYRGKNGNKIHYAHLRKIPESISLHFSATFARKDASLSPRPIADDIKSEPYLRSTTDIKRLADTVKKEVDGDEDIARTLFRFVCKNMRYAYPVKERGAEKRMPGDLRGDCGEYTALFVALCRAAGIPAMPQTGFVINPKKGIASEHAWARIYLKKIGWTNVDPQYASLEKTLEAGEAKYFRANDGCRISFSNGYSLPLNPKVKKGYQWTYLKKAGLPATNRSAQVLQPIFFASPDASIRIKSPCGLGTSNKNGTEYQKRITLLPDKI